MKSQDAHLISDTVASENITAEKIKKKRLFNALNRMLGKVLTNQINRIQSTEAIPY